MKNHSTRLVVLLTSLWIAAPVAADIEAAQAAYDGGDFDRAASLATPLAESGDPAALNLLGLMHHYGQGTTEDDARAFELFRRAADGGLAAAQYTLANMYMYGYGIPEGTEEPEREAVRLYIDAALGGNADSQYTLGLMLLAGSVVIQDPEEAMVWIQRAAAQGHEAAQDYVDSNSGS